MYRNSIYAILVVLLGLAGTASALYVNDTQTWTTETNIQDLTDKTLEIGPSGNLTIDARVNMDANAMIIMSGGVLTTTGDFKCPDSGGTQDVQIWINSGTMTSFNIENRIAVVPGGTTTWSSSSGVGDPDHNWTYLVVAVDGSEQQITQSNRFGEYDYGVAIP